MVVLKNRYQTILAEVVIVIVRGFADAVRKQHQEIPFVRFDRRGAIPGVIEGDSAASDADDETLISKVSEYIVGVSGDFGIPGPEEFGFRLQPVSDLTGGLLGRGDSKGKSESEEKKTPEPVTVAPPDQS